MGPFREIRFFVPLDSEVGGADTCVTYQEASPAVIGNFFFSFQNKGSDN
jgi:hypothetical protein